MNRSIQRHDRGYTLTELLIALWAFLCIGMAGGAIWAAVHYIHKFW